MVGRQQKGGYLNKQTTLMAIIEEIRCENCNSDKALSKIEEHGVIWILCKKCNKFKQSD